MSPQGALVLLVFRGVGHPSLPLLGFAWSESIGGATKFLKDVLSGEQRRFSVQVPGETRLIVEEVVKGAVPAGLIIPSENFTKALRLDDPVSVALLEAEADRFAKMNGIRGPDGAVIRPPWVLVHGLPESSEEAEG